MIITVTPDEFIALKDIAARAARTVPHSHAEAALWGTLLSDEVWIAGVRELFGEPTTTLMLHNQPVHVFVDYQ